MSKPLSTQADIAVALGITKLKMSKLIHENKIQLPPVIRQVRRKRYYDPIAVDKYIQSEPLKKENLLTSARRHGQPQLDNDMGTQFIIGARTTVKPKTFADIVKKHLGQRPQTTVVHLEERNEYIPPHSAFSLNSHSGVEHRLSVSF